MILIAAARYQTVTENEQGSGRIRARHQIACRHQVDQLANGGRDPTGRHQPKTGTRASGAANSEPKRIGEAGQIPKMQAKQVDTKQAGEAGRRLAVRKRATHEN